LEIDPAISERQEKMEWMSMVCDDLYKVPGNENTYVPVDLNPVSS
jgi:hypothetical protein